MNGPEHYQRAEALLDACQIGGPESSNVDDEGRTIEAYPGWHEDADDPGGTISNHLLAAQVHATLAQAAAIAKVERYPDASPLAERPSGWDRGRPGDVLTWAEVLR